MTKKLIRSENSIELWHLMHSSGTVEVFTVSDRRRTPETWAFGTPEEADEKFQDRLLYAEKNQAILPG